MTNIQLRDAIYKNQFLPKVLDLANIKLLYIHNRSSYDGSELKRVKAPVKRNRIIIADSKEEGLMEMRRLAEEDYAEDPDRKAIPLFDGTLIPKDLFQTGYDETMQEFNRLFDKPGLPAGVMVAAKADFADIYEDGLLQVNGNSENLYLIVAKTDAADSESEALYGASCLQKKLEAEIYDISMSHDDRLKMYTDFFEDLVIKTGTYAVGVRKENEEIVDFVLRQEKQYPGEFLCKLIEIISRTKLWGTAFRLSEFEQVFIECPHIKPSVTDYYDHVEQNLTNPCNAVEQVFKSERNQCRKIDFDKEFSEFAGMEDVKTKIKSIFDMFEYNRLRSELGMEDVNFSHTYMFLGPPGTAKTSIAKTITNLLFREGYIENEHVAFTTGAQLKGKFVGHSAPKVARLFEENSVIFIDEAYSVISGDGERDSFANEALAELLVQIENHAKDRVVIFAGYGGEHVGDKDNKMKDFLDANPGIASRINRTICFNPYTPEESLVITKKIAQKNGLSMDAGCDKVLSDYFEKRAESPDFGNGRECRSLVENSIVSLSSRVALANKNEVTKTLLSTITSVDIKNAVNELLAASKAQAGAEEKKIKLGFQL